MWRRMIIVKGLVKKQKMHRSGCHGLQIGPAILLTNESNYEHNSVLQDSCMITYQEILGKSEILLFNESNKRRA